MSNPSILPATFDDGPIYHGSSTNRHPQPQANHTMSQELKLTDSERNQLAEILGRRANEIASFKSDLNERLPKENRLHELPGSVELALSREIDRLRGLKDKIKPVEPDEE